MLVYICIDHLRRIINGSAQSLLLIKQGG